jgi:uncharacterized protein (TIGR02611 family)
MKKFKKAARKIGVALVGFPLLVVGIILIPLPGPGLLVCAAALFILALEFEWAEKHLKYVKDKLKYIIEKSKPNFDDKPKSEKKKN